MTFVGILFVLSLSLLLGSLALGARLSWLSQYPIRPYWLSILLGSSVAVSMLGLLGLAKALACWLTIYC